MSDHRRIEERSLRLHHAVAEKLLGDPAVLARARQRVERWQIEGPTHPYYAQAWSQILSLPPEQIAERLVDPGETMRALRQSSPFAGALDPRERWEILHRAREEERR